MNPKTLLQCPQCNHVWPADTTDESEACDCDCKPVSIAATDAIIDDDPDTGDNWDEDDDDYESYYRDDLF